MVKSISGCSAGAILGATATYEPCVPIEFAVTWSVFCIPARGTIASYSAFRSFPLVYARAAKKPYKNRDIFRKSKNIWEKIGLDSVGLAGATLYIVAPSHVDSSQDRIGQAFAKASAAVRWSRFALGNRA